jgi:hypothetical protein
MRTKHKLRETIQNCDNQLSFEFDNSDELIINIGTSKNSKCDSENYPTQKTRLPIILSKN